jgi:hypothetical protein
MMDTASLNDSQIINQCQREHKDAYSNVACIPNAIKGMGCDFLALNPPIFHVNMRYCGPAVRCRRVLPYNDNNPNLFRLSAW